MKRLAALLAACVMAAPALAEYISTEQLLQLDTQVRQKGDVNTATFITGYISGVFDALKGPVHCVDEHAVTVQHVIKAIRADEALQKESADVAIGTVLSRIAGPCGKPTTGPLPQGQKI